MSNSIPSGRELAVDLAKALDLEYVTSLRPEVGVYGAATLTVTRFLTDAETRAVRQVVEGYRLEKAVGPMTVAESVEPGQ